MTKAQTDLIEETAILLASLRGAFRTIAMASKDPDIAVACECLADIAQRQATALDVAFSD